MVRPFPVRPERSRRAFAPWSSVLALSLMLAACSNPATEQPSNSGAETPVLVEELTPPPPSSPPVAPTPAAANVLTAEGYGPLRIGMTGAQITEALGPDANPDADSGAEPELCDQYRPTRAPEGMLLMVEQDRLTRISLIRNSKVKTDRGLGLGATAAEVRAAYGGKLQASPHKYGEPPSEYLTVWAKGGGTADRAVPQASRGIRYEMDGTGKVGSIHAGGPSITYVEGCA